MRETEFWRRLAEVLGDQPSRTWSRMVVLRDLDERTVVEALEAGVPAKQVWAAVWRFLELPESLR